MLGFLRRRHGSSRPDTVPVTITRDHLHPTETLRGDDPVREFVVSVHSREPRLTDLVAALKDHGPVAATWRDNPTAWVLRDRGNRQALAVIVSDSGQNVVEVHPVHDAALPIAADGAFHLDRLAFDEVEATVARARHHNAAG